MPLLLLHALAQDADCWAGVGVPGAVALTLPGHGGRDWTGGGLAHLADDVAAQMGTPSDVAGVALGGMVALKLAARHPEQVSSVILVSTPARANGSALLERAALADTSGMAGVLEPTLAGWFSPEFVAGRDRHAAFSYARSRLLGMDPKVYAAVLRAMAVFDCRPWLGKVHCPVSVIHAVGDASVSAEEAFMLRRGLARARWEDVRGSHMLHLERPAEFRKLLKRHLDWIRLVGQHPRC